MDIEFTEYFHVTKTKRIELNDNSTLEEFDNLCVNDLINFDGVKVIRTDTGENIGEIYREEYEEDLIETFSGEC